MTTNIVTDGSDAHCAAAPRTGRRGCRRSRLSRRLRCASPPATGSTGGCSRRKRCRSACSTRRRSRPSPLPAGVDDWTAWRFRQIAATGEYDARRQILIDNKVHDGRVGFDVVTPLHLADGRAVLVDRGWIAGGPTRARLPQAPPPEGTITLRGRIDIPARDYFELGDRKAPAGPIWEHLDPARFAQASGIPVLPIVVEALDRRSTATWCATGRGPMSASSGTSATWCSGTRSRRWRRGCGSGSRSGGAARDRSHERCRQPAPARRYERAQQAIARVARRDCVRADGAVLPRVLRVAARRARQLRRAARAADDCADRGNARRRGAVRPHRVARPLGRPVRGARRLCRNLRGRPLCVATGANDPECGARTRGARVARHRWLAPPPRCSPRIRTSPSRVSMRGRCVRCRRAATGSISSTRSATSCSPGRRSPISRRWPRTSGDCCALQHRATTPIVRRNV